MSLSSTEARIRIRTGRWRSEKLRSGQAGGHGLSDIHIAFDHHSIDGGEDVGVGQILAGPVEIDLGGESVALATAKLAAAVSKSASETIAWRRRPWARSNSKRVWVSWAKAWARSRLT